MRSVIAYLSETTCGQVTTYLNQRYPLQAHPWVIMNDGDPVLYIDLYDDLAREAEPAEITQIIEALGAEIAVSVIVDISGRHPGRNEVKAFICDLLACFHGVVEDDYTEHLWSLSEVQNNGCYQGRHFCEYEPG